MTIKYFVYTSLFITGTLFFGCAEHPYKTELDDINDLELVLDSAKTIFNSIDLENVVVTKAKIEDDRNLLINYVNDNPDSMSTQIGTLIDDLRIALKNLKKMESNQGQLKKQISYSTQQLFNLRNDLKNNVLKAEDAGKYVRDEKKAITSLKKAVDQMKHYSHLGVLKYENNKELIDSLKQLAR